MESVESTIVDVHGWTDGHLLYVVSNSSAGTVSRPKFPYPLQLSWLRADAAHSSSSALEVVSPAEVEGRYVIRSSEDETVPGPVLG